MKCPHDPPSFEKLRTFADARLSKQPLRIDDAYFAVREVDRFYMENVNKWSIDDTHEISCIENSIMSLRPFLRFVLSVRATTKSIEVYSEHSYSRQRILLKEETLSTLQELIYDIRGQLDFASRARDRLEVNIRFNRQVTLTYLQISAGLLTLLIALLALVI